MTIGRILYDNLYKAADAVNFAYSAAEVAGFEKENAIDWRAFSLFRVAVGGSTLDIEMGSNQALDSFGWYFKTPTNDYTFNLQYESAPAVFTTLATVDTSIDKAIGLKVFNEVTVLAGRKIRVQFVGLITAEDVRELTAGKVLTFPIGQHQGIAPPNLRGEFVQSNVIGINGELLGRDKVRAEIQGEINLEFTDPDTWVRDSWDKLQAHAERYAFFYAWNLDDYADEVVFAWARETPRPINTGPRNKMTTRLPWSALAS